MDTKSQQTEVTIKDVADYVGVHRSTASKVLNNDKNFKSCNKTRKRILKAAERLGFVRNDSFHAPVGVRNFGLIRMGWFDRTDNPFYSEVFDGINAQAHKEKLNMYLVNTLEKLNLLHLLRQEHFMGIITIGGVMEELLAPFELTQKPLIGIEAPGYLNSSVLYTVRTDSFQNMYRAARYVIQAGHRRIYYIGFTDNGKEPLASYERYEGVHAALKEAQLFTGRNKYLAEHTDKGNEYDTATDAGYRAMMQLLQDNPPLPLACVCYSDLHAEGAGMAAKERGLRIPEDVSLVGYDNINRAQEMSPPLTTTNVPRFELGCQAIRILLEIEQGIALHDTILPTNLVMRQSVLIL